MDGTTIFYTLAGFCTILHYITWCGYIALYNLVELNCTIQQCIDYVDYIVLIAPYNDVLHYIDNIDTISLYSINSLILTLLH